MKMVILDDFPNIRQNLRIFAFHFHLLSTVFSVCRVYLYLFVCCQLSVVVCLRLLLLSGVAVSGRCWLLVDGFSIVGAQLS